MVLFQIWSYKSQLKPQTNDAYKRSTDTIKSVVMKNRQMRFRNYIPSYFLVTMLYTFNIRFCNL